MCLTEEIREGKSSDAINECHHCYQKHGQSKSLALGNWLISLSVLLVLVLVTASVLLGQTYSISNAYILIGAEQLQEPQSELQRALQQWGRQRKL